MRVMTRNAAVMGTTQADRWQPELYARVARGSELLAGSVQDVANQRSARGCARNRAQPRSGAGNGYGVAMPVRVQRIGERAGQVQRSGGPLHNG